MEFLSLKELDRLLPHRRRQTSAHVRYLTANTTAAQRLRALGQPVCRAAAETIDPCRSGRFYQHVKRASRERFSERAIKVLLRAIWSEPLHNLTKAVGIVENENFISIAMRSDTNDDMAVVTLVDAVHDRAYGGAGF
jgi:hypothetical protein